MENGCFGGGGPQNGTISQCSIYYLTESINACVVQLSVIVTRLLKKRQLKKRKGLFWFTVLKVSVHAKLTHCFFGPLVKQYIMVGSVCWRKPSPNLCREAKERERKKLEPQHPLKGMPPSDLTSSC
jgi:hypothetical protein